MLYKSSFDELEADDDEPLVIHGHSDQPRDSLIVFLHGLGGKRYETWTHATFRPAEKSFPKFLHEDFDQLDIGLYAYRTLLGRFRFWKSIPLEQEASVLADRLRQLVQSQGNLRYRSIILAGHSMGGILARAALADLIQKGDRTTLNAIKGLFLMATPQAGSLRVPRFLSWLTSDTRALAAHGELVTRIQMTLINHVVSDAALLTPDRYHIRSYIVSGAEDNWVDRFSAGLGARAEDIVYVRASHTSSVKPQHKTNDTYLWVKDRLDGLLSPLRAPRNPFDDCDLAGKLLINRALLRTGVRNVIDPDGRARILAVKGQPRCGKSHSIYFIEHIERSGNFEKVVVQLDQNGSPATFGPVDLAASLLQLLQRDVTHIPKRRPAQTKSRWVQTIAEHVVGHLKAKGGIILIILDGFAHQSLPDTTRELIRELIRHTDRERNLRMALLDYNDDMLIAQASGRCVIEAIRDITDEDIKHFFTSLARSSGLPDPTSEVLDFMVRDVRAAVTEARQAGSPGNQSDNEHVGKAAQRWAEQLSVSS